MEDLPPSAERRSHHPASNWCKAQRALSTQVPDQHPLSLAHLANIDRAFDASDMTIKVDVVDWASISESFRKIVSSNAVVVQQAKATD